MSSVQPQPQPQPKRSIGGGRLRYITILVICILLLPSLRDMISTSDRNRNRIASYALNTYEKTTAASSFTSSSLSSSSCSQSQRLTGSRTTAPCDTTTTTTTTSTAFMTDALLLAHQVRLQSEFQDYLYRNQHPWDCRRRRILLTPGRHPMLDGFTLEVQSSGRRLQAALALDRTLVYRRNFRSSYAPNPCQWTSINMTDMKHTDGHQFNCLFEPISNCTYENIDEGNTMNNSIIDAAAAAAAVNPSNTNNATTTTTTTTTPASMQSFGIISHGASGFFHSGLFGHDRIRDDAKFSPRDVHQNIDHIPHWERTMGRFWIRAQMVHYLWKPSIGLKSEMTMRLPKELITSLDDDDNNNEEDKKKKKKYIGMHVRYTDNVGSFVKDFDRNATVTRNLEHFMSIAKDIRAESGISTVYIATDSTIFLDSLYRSNYYKNKTNTDTDKNELSNDSKNVDNDDDDWTFVIQPNVIRSSSMEWMWFRNERSLSAAGIAADVEILRRADYLIGSFQSNVFRLATELNTAYMVHKYPIHMNRHRTVDVEWCENP